MTLRLVLKPGEVLMLGRTRLTLVSQGNCTVLVDGSGPVLRTQDYVEADDTADAVARLRYVVQQIYLEDDAEAHHAALEGALDDVQAAFPALQTELRRLRVAIAGGSLWEAVKICRRLGGQVVSMPASEAPAARVSG